MFRYLFQSDAGNATRPYTVRLTGWRPGLRKISLTDALVEFGELPVTEAKHMVDRLLTGATVEIIVRGTYPPEGVVRTLQEIGAVVRSDVLPEPSY